MSYFDFLNYAFAPLFRIPAVLAVLIVAITTSIIVTLVTKFATNQDQMKKIKDEMSMHQKKIKEFRDNPSKVMEINKKVMGLNLDYMRHSFKAIFITLIPSFLILGWMGSNFAYEGIKPGQEFAVRIVFENGVSGIVNLTVPEGLYFTGSNSTNIGSGIANWTLKGGEGEYLLEFAYNGEKYQHSVLIGNDGRYLAPIKKIKNGGVARIEIEYIPKSILNLFGWKMGWFLSYFIFSLIFTASFRKILKVY